MIGEAEYVKHCWYVAGWTSDIDDGRTLALTIIGEPVVVYRDTSGRPVALQDRCCHKRAKLSTGRIEGDCIRCMYHGLLFDPNGQCIEIPGQDVIPPGSKVRRFPVVEDGAWLWVWMGDPAAADAALIPLTYPLDSPDWDLRTGQMDYNADYQLINDNLTDFSHLSFVHTNSFGASAHWAQVRPLVRRIDRGIRISRWVTGGAQENRNVSGVVGRSAETPCTYIAYDYLVPGILIMRSETYRTEDMPADQKSEPTGKPASATTTCQAVTPMTADTTRYFFTTGPRRSATSGPGADRMMEITRIAFTEDREMIESQAENIRASGGSEMMTSADVGAVQFRSIIRALIRAERDSPTPAAVSAKPLATMA